MVSRLPMAMMKGDIMSEKKSDLEVLGCSVRYDDDVAVFHETKVRIKGNVRKMLGDKIVDQRNLDYIVDLDGVPICNALIPFAASVRIKIATIRDDDNFPRLAAKLTGTTIAYNDIDDIIGKEGKGRQPMLVKWLVSTGKFDQESARAVYDDPGRRAKAQEMFDRLMKQAEVDDL